MIKGLLKIGITLGVISLFSTSVFAGGLPNKLPVKRGSSSFTHGFKILSKQCAFHKQPTEKSKRVLKVKQGRKIWMTAMDSQWLIAKTKRTARNTAKSIYIHKSCVN